MAAPLCFFSSYPILKPSQSHRASRSLLFPHHPVLPPSDPHLLPSLIGLPSSPLPCEHASLRADPPTSNVCFFKILFPYAMESNIKPKMGSQESSLLQIVQDHQLGSVHIREQTDKARKDALKAVTRVFDLFVDCVNGGVEEVFVDQKRIESEIRLLSIIVTRYKKQTNQWLATSNAMNSVLKGIRDFEN